MILTAKVKLRPSKVQADSLRRTLEKANAACDFISHVAWSTNIFNKFQIQKLVYQDAKVQFDLNANLVIRCIAKVTDAYKINKKIKREFKPLGSIAFNSHILSWKLDKNKISIWSVDGRIKNLSFVCHSRAKELLAGKRGESDLCLINGEFYLFTACQVNKPGTKNADDFLGIDLGITNIAVDSDGEIHQGKTLKNVHFRHRKLRQKLQKKGTHSSRRRLKKLAGKERRFSTWVNHNISKHMVVKAKDTGRGIAIEELGGIRDRVTVKKSQRATLYSWSFFQLRIFIEYKAQLMGVKVQTVDPRNTSRTCPCCGHVSKQNRKTQSRFFCVDCGYSGLADHIAALNIRVRGRASVTTPNVPIALS